jgi:hypothetical protein
MPTPARTRQTHYLLNCLLGAFALFLVFLIISVIIYRNNPVPASSSWTVTHTFSGTGNADTANFTTYNHWRLRWKCHPEAEPFQFIANATNDTKDLDYITYSVCDESTPNGLADGHIDGTITLEIMTQGAWSVDVEEWE